MSNVPYQPLDRSRREIRLIILKDVENTANPSNTADLPLKCELIATSLDLYKVLHSNYSAYEVNKLRNALARSFLKGQPYSREFYALSYVWGDPAAVCDLEINGTPAKIGASLHAALQSIRKNTKFRVIWADALCINQGDNEEKSWQVQQMAAIYSRARATISWLGPPSEDSKLALETLVELDKKTSHLFWSIQMAMEGGPPPSVVKKSVLQLARDSSRWNAIANICARLYWSRIWIFQEMACARDKYFLCGDSTARDIDRPISLLLAWQVMGGEIHSKPLGSHCLSMVNSVQTFRFHGNFPSDAPYYIRPGTLHEMLVKLSTLNATQPQDMIYAPLGIATDRDQLDIVPDYSKDLDRIFKEIACALLREGCLGVLLSASLQDKCSHLPSWVPHWSTSFDADPGRIYCADSYHSQRSSTLKAIPQLSDHVTLDGYVVGRIIRIYDPCPVTALESLDVESDNPTFSDWLNQVEATIFPMSGKENSDRKPKSGYGTPESAIAELLSAAGGPQPVWSLFPNPYLHVYKALKSAKSLKSLILDLRNDSSRKQDPYLVNCVTRIQYNLESGSRPYQIDSGVMGLTWKDKDRLGDVVVVIPGVCMPCVLRRLDTKGISTTTQASDHYQLIGVTYVYGIMNGEFLKKNTRELQTFTLY
jgi:hypothetical protein